MIIYLALFFQVFHVRVLGRASYLTIRLFRSVNHNLIVYPFARPFPPSDAHIPSACGRASFLGAYRLVPPFQAPTGCPEIPACAQHGRLKHGCRRCEDVEKQAAAAVAVVGGGTRLMLGAPLPPAKFYTRAMVSRLIPGQNQVLLNPSELAHA